jgi:hypothetical protein
MWIWAKASLRDTYKLLYCKRRHGGDPKYRPKKLGVVRVLYNVLLRLELKVKTRDQRMNHKRKWLKE